MEMTADPTLRYKSFLDIIGFGIGSGFGIADFKLGNAVFNLTLREMRRL
jgi:hypothetical protein